MNSKSVRLLIGIGVVLLPRRYPSSAAQTPQQSPRQRPRGYRDGPPLRMLQDGRTECAGCGGECVGKTITSGCAVCATGQTWWPCNLVNECYCKDDSAASPASSKSASAPSPLISIPSEGCVGCQGENLQCVGTTLTENQCAPCATGQTWWPCNLVGECYCKNSSPTLAPSHSETSPPTIALEGSDAPSGSGFPSVSLAPSVGPTRPSSAASDSGSGESTATSGSTGSAQAGSSAYGPEGLAIMNPAALEGMYVMDAHLNANKVVLARELFSSPGGGGGANDFSYRGFRSTLRAMIAVGAAGKTFHVGWPTKSPEGNNPNGRAYGLVNIAAFLAMSHEDSITHGSCDEVNHELVGGLLPISNACGQDGVSYQDLMCPLETLEGGETVDYNCFVDPTMRMQANPVDIDQWGDEDGNPPRPFYCGPVADYGGSTGGWDYVSGVEIPDQPLKSAMGRQDVQGCCWWGRGSIQLRGACAYGKLNYYLGKRAADEGRPSMFPGIDFCRNPQAVCSSANERAGTFPYDIKWAAGMFRWITDVQAYETEGFNYMQRLVEFVDGGLVDWSFAHSVAGIVTQGCHDPPCAGSGGKFDGSSRKAMFIKTLRLLGLSTGDGGSTA